MMNNCNEAITSLESNKETNEESFPSEYRFDFDVELNTDFDVNLLKIASHAEAETNDCYILGYN